MRARIRPLLEVHPDQRLADVVRTFARHAGEHLPGNLTVTVDCGRLWQHGAVGTGFRGHAMLWLSDFFKDWLHTLIHDLLRWQVRESRGRLADPSLVVLDTQSLHAAAGVPAATTGRDAAKKVPCRKRGLAVDVLGLVVAVVVLAASTHDNAFGTALLDKVAAGTSRVTKALVDQGFKKTVADHGAGLGIAVEIVERNPVDRGFVPQPIRWRVEQTNGILMLHRRLVRDYDVPDGGNRLAERLPPRAPRRSSSAG
ncbi:hypothetical protein P3T27_006269 [Kitasatospora sp. MAA19]|uniref:transposase n=1 Tax=Kitasatospora sp. MAA19 TaxID=3035090 RepID=UPI00247437B9|nr:transposase [Kitasatospora sp. MAA19]MDH6709521.1 hypothetical protein [Kitasatospora sp. MAA19]